jgi:O-antigen/teichoic acid export membrane protein
MVVIARRRGELRALAARAAGASTGRNAAVTIVGGFGVQLSLMVSGVIVARALGVEDRGHLALLWVIALATCFLATTGLWSAVTYSVARQPQQSLAIARLIVRVGLVQAAIGVAVQAGVLMLVIGGSDGSVQAAAVLSLAVVPSMLAVVYGMAFLQGLERFKSWTAIRLIPAVLYTVGVAALAVVGQATLVAVTLAWTLSYGVAAVVAIVKAKKSLPASTGTKRPSLRELQIFGAKGFLGSASPMDTLQLDQLLVGLFLSPAALGLYVVGLAFTNLPRILAQSIGFVAYPHVARQPTREVARRSMWAAAGLSAILIAAIVAILELSAGWLVPFFFGDAFAGAIPLTRILLAGAAFVSVRRVLADAARGAGYPGLGTIAELVSSVAVLPLIAILASAGGSKGVAWGVSAAAALGLGVLVIGLIQPSARQSSENRSFSVAADPSAEVALTGEPR